MRAVSIGVMMVGLLVTGSAASAQHPAPPVGQKVWITMADASVHHGTVAQVNAEAVTVVSDGASMALATKDVRRIEVPDRVGDGVARGAIGLAIVGGLGTGLMGAAVCEFGCLSYAAQMGLFGAVTGGAAGAIIGGLLDAANPGRDVLFDRASLTIAPVVARRSRSVSVRISW